MKKQGEHANFRNKIQIGDKVTRNEDGVLVNLSQLNRVAKKDEKQGEQKETLCDKCRREQPSHSCQDIAELGRCALEHQSKQKPTDNAEPKFKAGDFVVNKFGRTKLITNIENGCYRAMNIDDNTEWYGSIEYANTHFHQWTIQDAKDGDVLASKSGCPFIYRKTNGVSAHFYCCVSPDNDFLIDNYRSYCGEKKSTKPATKEQRELLFQKMKEAGYEWDTEKKELKKIEQKPDEWKPQTGDTFRKKGTTSPTYHLCAKREDGITFGFLQNREAGISGGEITIFALKNDYELVKRPKSIEDVVEEELNRALQTKIEQKPAWSEEDEWKFSDILALLRGGENYHYNTPELFAWLKSFKDKLQPKREWSEEDEKKIMWLVRLISTAGFRELDNDKMPCSRSALLDWLKSLKPKSHWKPSEEQMQILHKFSVPHAVVSEEDAKNLERIYADLKQL